MRALEKNLAHKACGHCKEIKAVNEFYRSNRNSGCYESWCKKCKAATWNKKNYFGKYWPGLSVEQAQVKYNELYTAQDGCCAICDKHQSELQKALAVDHCHDAGHVRGLLCQECNLALGKLKDSIESLEKAITYLNKTRLSLVKETMC